MAEKDSKNAPKLFVVDDELAVAKILVSILERRGYHVSVAHSIAEATEVLDTKTFDACIFDWKLLDGNGLDLAAHMRSKGDKTPIVFVTGFANSEMALNAAQLGIQDIVSKPFSSQELYESLERILPNFRGASREAGHVSDAMVEQSLGGGTQAPDLKPKGSPTLYLIMILLLVGLGVMGTLYLLKL